MGRMVLLRHDLPDGSHHYDWMLERENGRALLTFRVGVRLDEPGCTRFDATRLGDHRAAYLTYEGDVSGGRGRVTRVAAGTVEGLRDEPGAGVVTARVCWGGAWVEVRGARTAGNAGAMGEESWAFTLTAR